MWRFFQSPRDINHQMCYQRQHGAWPGVSPSLRVQGLPTDPMSPQDTPRAPLKQSLGVPVLSPTKAPTTKSSVSPRTLSPTCWVTVSSPKAQTHQHEPPCRRLPPTSGAVLYTSWGPQHPPADPRLWLLLPRRGVQGEGGEGAGEELGVPELDFMFLHLPGGAERGSEGPIQEPQGQGHGLAWGHLPQSRAWRAVTRVSGGGEPCEWGRIWIFMSCPFKNPKVIRGRFPLRTLVPGGVHHSSQGQA